MPATGEAANGFTLFEMLVVLAILGLIGGLVYPALGRSARAAALGDALATTASALREGRARALRYDRPVLVGVDRAGVHVGRDAGVALPAAIAGSSMPAAGVLFMGDGSTPGGFVMLTAGDQVRRLRIAPTTGLLLSAAG